MNLHIPYVLHWNGTSWSLVRTPNHGGAGSLLNGIVAASAGGGTLFAVGARNKPGQCCLRTLA